MQGSQLKPVSPGPAELPLFLLRKACLCWAFAASASPAWLWRPAGPPCAGTPPPRPSSPPLPSGRRSCALPPSSAIYPPFRRHHFSVSVITRFCPLFLSVRVCEVYVIVSASFCCSVSLLRGIAIDRAGANAVQFE